MPSASAPSASDIRPAQLRIDIDAGRVRLTPDGDLDVTHAGLIFAAVRAAGGSRAVVFDVRRAELVSLSVLVAARDAAHAARVSLAVLHPSTGVRRLLALLDSEEESLHAG
jgi:hypothetical protein